MQKELNLPFDSAEQLKKGQPVDGVAFDDVRPVLHAMTENVLLEIQKTFDFFKATAASDRIDRDRAERRRVARRRVRARRSRSGSARRSKSFDPFKKIAFEPQKLGVDRSRAGVEPTAAVAVGLALRRAGDR